MSNQASATLLVDRQQRRLRFPLNLQLPPNNPFQVLPLIRAARTALTTLRFLPIFTPRQTISRWRARRELTRAARAATPRENDSAWINNFRMNGLTWHHLYISQDLRKIRDVLKEICVRVDRGESIAMAKLIPLERSFGYLLDNVWDVYNSLERDVLFPWVVNGVNDEQLERAVLLMGRERARIEDEADVIQSRFAKLVCSTGYPYASMGNCKGARRFSATRARREKRKREAADARARGKAVARAREGDGRDDERRKKASLCLRTGYEPEQETLGTVVKGVNVDEIRAIGMDISTIIEDAEQLHRTERSLLFPLIAKTFPEREQGKVTNVLVYSMRPSLAKFIITIYHQAVEKAASRQQWRFYKREVPLPIRVYTPVWRARLYDGCPLGWLRNTQLNSTGDIALE